MSEINLAAEQNNTGIMAPQQIAEIMEKVLLHGDLSKLEPKDRLNYYNATCQSLKLNPLTKPFDYISMKDGKGGYKTVLYATKNCTEQLRVIRGISITKLTRNIDDGLLTVEAHAIDSEGRTDVATGALWIGDATGNIRGDNLAVAYMKAETKAKRRVTLSIAGLGMMDETEVDDVRNNNNYNNRPEIDNNLVNTTLAKYSLLVDESDNLDLLKANFTEGWKELQKFKQRDGAKEAAVKLNQEYLAKKKLLEPVVEDEVKNAAII